VRWSTLQNALTNPNDPLRYYTNMTGSYSEDWTPRSPALFEGDGENRLYDPFVPSPIFNPIVLAEIILPNGQHYLFTYNVWGEMTKVVYPTGAYERFAYDTVAGVGYLEWPYTQANRGVVDRWLSPTGNSGDEVHWHYAAAVSNFLTVSTTEPDNTVTERVMNAEISQGQNTYGFSWAELGMQLEERKFASAGGAMLRRKLTKWTSSGALPGGWTYATRNPRAIKVVNILLDTGTSNALTSTTTMDYDSDLNVKATNQYDFTSITQSSASTWAIDSITPGNLLRTEETTYLVNDLNLNADTRAAYRNRNLLRLPTSSRVRKPAGCVPGDVVAEMKTSYDDYDPTGSYQTGNYPLLTYGGTITSWTDPGNLRGLPTTSSVWLNTTNAFLQTHVQYDLFGNLRNSWDANGNQSQVTYSSAYLYAYPTTSSTAVPDPTGLYGSTVVLSTTADYYANTGLMTSMTDANGQSTTYTYDAIDRLATVTQPNGAHVTYSYSVAPPNLYVGVLTEQDASRSIETRKYFDGLGRGTREFVYEGTPSTPWLVADTYYDSMGRVSKISNPYRVSTPGSSVPATCSLCTTNGYDGLGRVLTVTTADGAQTATSFSASTSGTLGTVTTITDQALRKRRSLTDALGRLVRVDEPNKDTGSLDVDGASTFYTYNVLGSLLRVDQDSQYRFFLYDSLGRLLRAKNPEQGNFTPDADFPAMTDASSGVSNDQWSTGYVYDANGNPAKRKDARNIVTTSAYDALNRNTTIDYSNTPSINPDITRKYDSAGNGKGRFSESYAGGSENVGVIVEHTKILNYDAMGRPLDLQQRFKTDSAWGDSTRTYLTHRTYDLAGHVKTQTYPSGRIVTYNHDQAGRLGDKDAQNLAFTGNLGNEARTYSAGIVYSTLGRMSEERFGTDTALYNKSFYNSRGQLAEIRVGTYHATDNGFWNRGAIINHYSESCWGSCGGTNSATQMTDNNGNLKKQEVYVPNTEQNLEITDYTMRWQQYDYDWLNRLAWVREITNGAELWKQGFTYDRFGNRTINQGVTYGGGINNKSFTVNTANNRLDVPGGQTGAMDYDPAGNLTTDTYSAGAVTRDYDAENRLTKETQANSNVVGSYGYNADGRRVRRKVGTVETWQTYGMDGELLAEYAANTPNTSPQKEYGYRSGQLLIAATAGTSWGSAPTFANNPLVSGATTVQALHITQLRDAINALRGHMSLPAYSWQYSATTNDYISANPILEMRTALDQALGAPSPAYSAGLAQGQPIKAVHIQELRDRVLASWSSGSAVQIYWLVADQLGTPRIVLDKAGSFAGTKRHDYLPFGEELFAATGGRTTGQGYTAVGNVAADGARHHFTSKERDIETGLDYSINRYYSWTQGRFTSVDPMMASARLSNPQTMNRYVYVVNNPLRYIDPDGLSDKDPWASLTRKEQLLLAPKLVTVQDGYVPNEKQLAAAGEVFNNMVTDNGKADLKQTTTNVASVKAFVAELGSNKQAWSQVDKIQGVSAQGDGRVADVSFTAKNNEAFISALKSDPRFRYRESEQNHVDSFRLRTVSADDPSFHVDRKDAIFGAHWDPTSTFNLQSQQKVMNGVFAQDPLGAIGGMAEMGSAGIQHYGGRATVEQVQKFITPSKQ
jgi:RHS repeat-associated protein